ncbi:MAG: hypothetical protein HFE76_03295 [Firmicutes bacterium]|nr:hypothetical protein [Bacillota bacterium]
MRNERGEIIFEITERIGVIKPYPTGWNRELNMVSWNNTAAKYDIRDWDPEHEHMSRGMTFHPDEMRKVMQLLEGRDL